MTEGLHIFLLALLVAHQPAARYYTPSEPVTHLSILARGLKEGLTRRQVVERLGTPTWVFLPGDKSDFAPSRGEFANLLWKNGPCAPVLASFDASERLTGWDEGRSLCVQTGEYDQLPPAKKFLCKEKGRTHYCR
jgi:hypothetical protein